MDRAMSRSESDESRDNTTETAAESDDSPSADTRVVVANGIDLDKQYFYEVTKRMSRDRDLRKLSLLGAPLWAVLAAIALLIAVVGTVDWLQSAIHGSAVVVQRFETVPLWASTAVVVGLLVVVSTVAAVGLTFATAIFDTQTIRRQLGNLRLVFQRDIWQPLHYWYPFRSHLSDRDPLVPLGTDTDYTLSSIYADGPHYQNVFIDAIYVTPTGGLSLRQQVVFALYRWDHRRRTFRRLGYFFAAVATLGFLAVGFGVAEVPSLSSEPVGLLVAGGMGLALLVVAATVVAADYPYFLAQFYSDSAGLSQYGRLRNEQEAGFHDEAVGLSNSMCGYGLFFLSRFVAVLFGRRQFDLSFDPASLAPGEDSETAFPARGFDSHPGDEHATAAAAELLWASLPAASLAHSDREPDLTLELSGVDYDTITERDDGSTVRKTATAGDQTGFRVPIKRFMSVADGFRAESLRVPERPLDLLYSGDWDEETVHTLYIGGGEHQQAINKLTLAFKSAGYRNVDVRENAFGVGDTPGLFRRLRRRLGTSQSPELQSSTDEEKDDWIHFPTEYFVSMVSGGEEFFRQDDERHGHGFVLLRHDLEAAGKTQASAHVLIGMSAVGTKTGALFWQQLVEDDFAFTVTDAAGRTHTETIAEDVVYFFDAPGPTAHSLCDGASGGYDDIGDLYTDTAWRSAGLEFTVSRLEGYATRHAATDRSSKTMGRKYYALDIAGVSHEP